MQASFSIFPLGDNALLVDYGNLVDLTINKRVHALCRLLLQTRHPVVSDIIPAYSSLAVYYDLSAFRPLGNYATAYEQIATWVTQMASMLSENEPTESRTIRIPVCYAPGIGFDLEAIALDKNLTTQEVIRLHTERTYHVFMIGFLPGFAYMGEVTEQIAVPRRPEPRKLVPAGSVGIAGTQTGIYPQASPGGWQIIGRTPLLLFDKEREPSTLLQAGDQITFYPISEHEFAHY